ncbi:hypothetical protein [Nostoc favosum]|nr:hypothetical protein [Nostoc favosum]
MADLTDVLLKLCEQRWAEVKQAEDQSFLQGDRTHSSTTGDV